MAFSAGEAERYADEPVASSARLDRRRRVPALALRHTAVTNVYRASRDLFLAQRFARHVSPLTTTVYTHPSDEELFERVRNLTC